MKPAAVLLHSSACVDKIVPSGTCRAVMAKMNLYALPRG